MACGSENKTHSISDLLMCPICLDGLNDPKTLTCLHTFCALCLENCRRPYRRELTCPVCKKVTLLSAHGVQGLQNDFRIQQIRDILQQQQQHTTSSKDMVEEVSGTVWCNFCLTLNRQQQAQHHCVQCCMYFCHQCMEKHNANSLFNSHHVIDMTSDLAGQDFFCKTHKNYAVKYFCKTCNNMLCTICTIDHDESHNPIPVEKSMMEKYRDDLQISVDMITNRLAEIKTKSKYVETIKHTYQSAMYACQKDIKDAASLVMEFVKKEEQRLLREVQLKMEGRMKEAGIDNLVDITFHQGNLENLRAEVLDVLGGPAQKWLLSYEDLMLRVRAVGDTQLPSTPVKPPQMNVVQFMHAKDLCNISLGTLREKELREDAATEDADVSSPNSPPKTPRRITSILNALSHKPDVKLGKIKSYSHVLEKPKSPNAINADDLIGSSGIEMDHQPTSTCTLEMNPSSPGACSPSSPHSPPSLMFGCPSSPSTSCPAIERRLHPCKPVLLFNIDQIGGWPGKITFPSDAAFLPNGSLILAESENRLQVFDTRGHSKRILAWGKVKPVGIATSSHGRIAVTDKRDRCVKMFTMTGETLSDNISTLGIGKFSHPMGIAFTSFGNFVVVDSDKHMVSIHSSDGSILKEFGSWGSGDHQFNGPGFVTTSHDNKIYVSDCQNNCVKIFDPQGHFLSKFTLSCSRKSNHSQNKRPYGLCIDNHGNLLVADRDNHKVSLYTPDGCFIQHLLTKQDGIRYPWNIAINDCGLVAVVESYAGFLSKEPYHAFKLYQVLQYK